MLNRNSYGTFRVFAEGELSTFLDNRKRELTNTIREEDENYILNVNESDYRNHLINRFQVEYLEILIDDITVSQAEEHIGAEFFPGGFAVRRGKSYEKDVYTFHIPISGNIELLRMTPSRRMLWSTDVEYINGELIYRIIDFYGASNKIIDERDTFIERIQIQTAHVNTEVEKYNQSLGTDISLAISQRKAKILNSKGILAELGVPVKKSSNVPPTFSLPISKRTDVSLNSKPEVSTAPFSPEPALDDSTYHEILRTIHDVGRTFERLPSVYKDKGEEDLRDHMLMVLEPNFEGSATGETFNKKGKTDILIRHESKNVFIAECKFWHGKRGYLATIDQLLGYLTWRDSKAAIILFVENENFTKVIQSVKEATPTHSNYLEYVSESDDSWFNYKIHITGDRNREVKLAVMMYHLPEAYSDDNS